MTMKWRLVVVLTFAIGCVLVLTFNPRAANAQEIGGDFRISFVGGSGDPMTGASFPAVACRSTATDCLAVWHENITDQITIQRIDGQTAAHLGTPSTISSMSVWGSYPEVAYDPGSDRYLVIWMGYHDVGGGQIEVEVYGQLIDAATGTEVGPDDFRISHFGPAGDTAYQASKPAIANNPNQGDFLVAWMQEGGGTIRDIGCQLIDAATGQELGADFTITDAAGPVSSAFGANDPAVAHDTVNDEYLVVWIAQIESSGTGFEVFGQRLGGAAGAEIGDDVRISVTGVDGVNVDQHGVSYPAVAHAAATDRWVVVWKGNDDPDPQMAVLEAEVYLQALDGATGTLTGPRLRLSDTGGLGALAYSVFYPKVACGPDLECLVAWGGDDDAGALVDEEHEIFGQMVNTATLAEVGGNDVRISTMGATGNPNYDAYRVHLASIPSASRYLAVWVGDTFNPIPLVDGEFEVWGQRYAGGLMFSDGFESNGTGGWSSANP